MLATDDARALRKRVTAPLAPETYAALLIMKHETGDSLEKLIQRACDDLIARSAAAAEGAL